MALVVNSNVDSLVAQRNLARVSTRLTRNVARLSSGLRITSAADDAAGLGLAEKISRDVRALKQAQRNANDGISMANSADGALREIGNLLTRMRELSVQSLNDTNGQSERNTLNTEFIALRSEVDRIAVTAEFNGIKLLNTASSKNIHVGKGVSSDDRIAVATVDVDLSSLSLTSNTVSTSAKASTAVAAIDSAIDTISTKRGVFGAAVNRLDAASASLGDQTTALTQAESQIRDLDVAAETADYTRNQIMQKAGISVLAHANSSLAAMLRLLE